MAKQSKRAKLGTKLDKLLFGIPENRAKFMRTGRNPAHKRRLYRLGHEAARRNPAGDPGAALVAAERTMIFREVAVADLSGAREFFLAGYHDGVAEQANPKAQSAFDRCVQSVAAKGGAYDPRAVCAAVGRKKLGQAEMTRRSKAGKRAATKNPLGPDRSGIPARFKAKLPFTIYEGFANDQFEVVAHASEKTEAFDKAQRWANEQGTRFLVRWTAGGKQHRELFTPSRKNTSVRKSKKRGVKAAREYYGQYGPESAAGAEREVRSLYSKKGRFGPKKPLSPRAWFRKEARNPRNPLDTSQAAYEGFHGEKSKRTIVVQDRRHFHTHVWALGPLVYLKVWLPSDRRKPGYRNFVEVEFDYEGKNPVLVTANEKRNQMFFDGGDQSVDLKVFSVPPEPHETVVLGEVSDAHYFTTKKHLGNQGGTAIYKHKLGEEGGELPTLIYHTLEKRLSLAGGSYTIPNEGVRN
jgi:hypothetical protein